MGDHSSRGRIAPLLKQPTRTITGETPCLLLLGGAPSLFGLAPGGVYRAARRCRERGALLPHPFTFARPKPKVLRQTRPALCCTVPGVAPAGH